MTNYAYLFRFLSFRGCVWFAFSATFSLSLIDRSFVPQQQNPVTQVL
jgi:hypothetical protein